MTAAALLNLGRSLLNQNICLVGSCTAQTVELDISQKAVILAMATKKHTGLTMSAILALKPIKTLSWMLPAKIPIMHVSTWTHM
jgi:hypothetical protein